MSGIPSWVAATICIICGVLLVFAVFFWLLMDTEDSPEMLIVVVVVLAIGYFFGVQPLQDKNAHHDQHIAQLLRMRYPGMKAINVKEEGRSVSYHVTSEPNFACYADVAIKRARPTVTITRGGAYCQQLTASP